MLVDVAGPVRTLPIWVAPSNIKTVDETSAVPLMDGLMLLVEVLLAGLDMIGLAGGVESTVTMTAVEAGLLLWAASSALAVRVC